MDHAKKLDFIHKMAKLGLQSIPHFDLGGTVNTQQALRAGVESPSQPSTGNTVTAQETPDPTQMQGKNSQSVNENYADPTTSLGGGVAATLGLASTYRAGSADLQSGTNVDQLNNAYTSNQNALSNSDRLASALNPQVPAAVNQQAYLARQYQDMIDGRGPDVATNELNQATGRNVATQAALMAGQRGAGANPALIARLAAQQGAATQQDAAGQAATLKAQQQIAAQQNLTGLSANQIAQAGQAITGQNQAQQGEQNILQNANTAENNANVGMQSNINSTDAQTAAANANGIGGLIGSGISAIGSVFAAMAEGGEVGSNSDKSENQNTDDVQKYADGGRASPLVGNPLVQNAQAPSAGSPSFVGNYLNSPSSGGGPANTSSPSFGSDGSGAKALQSGIDSLGNMDFGGGSYSDTKGSAGYMPDGSYNDASAMPTSSFSSAGEGGLSSLLGEGEVLAAKGGEIRKKLAAKGGKVKAANPAEKAKVKDNSYSNDKIPALLSEGEVVIPRKIMMHPEAPRKAAEFVAAIIAKKGLKKS